MTEYMESIELYQRNKLLFFFTIEIRIKYNSNFDLILKYIDWQSHRVSGIVIRYEWSLQYRKVDVSITPSEMAISVYNRML